MIVGPFVDAASVAIGGGLGGALGTRLSPKFRETMTIVLGLPSMCMGIILVVKAVNMPSMVLSIILGTIIGEAVHLEREIGIAAGKVNILINKMLPSSHGDLSEEDFLRQFVAMLVLFCASGTGIFGAMHEGMTGDATILYAKSFLDLVTAAAIAAAVGYAIATIAIPQVIILTAVAISGTYIAALTTPMEQADFSSVGGVLMFATGLRMCGIKNFPVASMLPAMLLAMPISGLWTHYV